MLPYIILKIAKNDPGALLLAKEYVNFIGKIIKEVSDCSIRVYSTTDKLVSILYC